MTRTSATRSSAHCEFWQRWHICWEPFRDYLLYVPIFGKRRKYVSLFLVWFCTGFWHGASWNYILWGLYFGLFIFIETLVGKKRMKRIPAPLAHLYALLVIVVGFGIFKFENLADLGLFFKGLVANATFSTRWPKRRFCRIYS
ncbi:MAG: MBOAT family O-acyltransferase [Acutalibacteraceae bacterium]